MNRPQIIWLAVVYTLMMVLVVQFLDMQPRGALMIAVANVWFWVGRMSCQKAETVDGRL